jgi:hypothetical protein
MATTTTTPLPDSTSPEAPGHDEVRGRFRHPPPRPHLGRRRGRSRSGGPAVVTLSEPLAPVNAARERMIGASLIEVRRINATDGKAGSSLWLRCGGRLGSQPEEVAR